MANLQLLRLDQINGSEGWITKTAVVVDVGMTDNKRENVKPTVPLAKPNDKIL